VEIYSLRKDWLIPYNYPVILTKVWISADFFQLILPG
jgi:hypothetical protein